MKVVFLCGGSGKRMFPITEDKFLLDFLGKPLLAYQIERAMQAGLDHFVVIGNPGNIERIERITKDISGATVEFALQKEPLGIANALENAEPFLQGEVIVVNPNDVFDSSAYTDIIQEAQKGSALSYILGYRVQDYFPGGYLVVDSRNGLKHIVEKPNKGAEPSNLVNILVHLHSDVKKLLHYVKTLRSVKDDVYECALDQIVNEGHGIKVVPYLGFWAPIKYPWHIFRVVRHFLNGTKPYISPSAHVSGKATIEGTVILCDNVRVMENAVIRSPVYIGPNSIIGNNALVREYTHIGADCVVGYSTEVKASYIGDGCWFHSSYIGDSIIGDGCSLAAGTVLANWRFDEKNIRIKIGNELVDTGLDKLGAMIGSRSKTGVNVSVMPGIRIGPNSVVGSHVCLAQDLEANKSITIEPQHRIIDNPIELDETKAKELMKRLGGPTCVE